jgi:hypothetical protein
VYFTPFVNCTPRVVDEVDDVASRRLTNFPFKKNVPDPLLSGRELPTFKFALEQSEGKVLGASFAKEATVEQLPISKGIAGVSLLNSHSVQPQEYSL